MKNNSVEQAASRTTFFTYANRAYELYVLPYITSVLVHNGDARVEVCLESSNRFADANTKALDVLEHGFGGRFHLRNASKSESASASPNSVRFLEVPEVMLPYTYIGDVDVLCLETVSEQHLRRMAHTGLPYSNVLRPDKPALSGLHFTRSEVFYPQSLPSGADLQRDEYLLNQLVLSRGCALPDPDDRWRPVHGYHLSLNRAPLSPGKGPGWRAKVAYRRPIWDPRRWRRAAVGLLSGESLVGSGRRFDAYTRLQKNEMWQEMGRHFDHRYLSMLGLLDLALAAQVSKDCRKRGFTPHYGLSLLADHRLVQQVTRPRALGD